MPTPAPTAVVVTTLASLTALAAGGGEPVTFKPIASGGMAKIGYYAPQRAELTEARPETVKKVPEGLTAARYATLGTRSANPKAVFHVLLDEPEGQPARLWVDANGDGDFTNDPATAWEGKPGGEVEGKALTMYNGGADIDLGTGTDPYKVHVAFYRFDKNDPRRAALKNTLFYYRDYATEGEVTLDGKTYKAVLTDEKTSGDFRGAAPTPGDGKAGSGVMLLIDLNGNQKFDSKGERFDVRKPFKIHGQAYEIEGMNARGTSFSIVKSTKEAEEEATPPDLSVGKVIPSFTAKKMDGKNVAFPGDYKGKVVLLDFWATWCGPCMAEVPNVVAAYEKFHDKGFEILGVTLDNKDAEAKITQVTTDKKMTWAQVYDGGGWQARIAVQFGIDSIPATFLVDGTTGKILAANLRGNRLSQEVEKALKAGDKQ
jgi:thiol-disulfide isomerase/thioredoxin